MGNRSTHRYIEVQATYVLLPLSNPIQYCLKTRPTHVDVTCCTYLGTATKSVEHIKQNKASERHCCVSWGDLVIIGHLYNRKGDHGGAMLFANHNGGLHTKEARLQLQCNSQREVDSR